MVPYVSPGKKMRSHGKIKVCARIMLWFSSDVMRSHRPLTKFLGKCFLPQPTSSSLSGQSDVPSQTLSPLTQRSPDEQEKSSSSSQSDGEEKLSVRNECGRHLNYGIKSSSLVSVDNLIGSVIGVGRGRFFGLVKGRLR